MKLDEVVTRSDYKEWMEALFFALYDGKAVEDVCNSCAAMRVGVGEIFFPDEVDVLWGSTINVPGGVNNRLVRSAGVKFTPRCTCRDFFLGESLQSHPLPKMPP